mmetsp:Transcript_7584/g.16511  ORF Transcript_7584/g.16511 Transcript_7584/m.16511 type:complete len:172 (-) Transcript_7584:210-725(-)
MGLFRRPASTYPIIVASPALSSFVASFHRRIFRCCSRGGVAGTTLRRQQHSAQLQRHVVGCGGWALGSFVSRRMDFSRKSLTSAAILSGAASRTTNNKRRRAVLAVSGARRSGDRGTTHLPSGGELVAALRRQQNDGVLALSDEAFEGGARRAEGENATRSCSSSLRRALN